MKNMFLSLQRYNIAEVAVYLATFDQQAPLGNVQPIERNEYVGLATHPLVRAQRYWVWRLLDVAISEQFGKLLSELSVVRISSGKWVCADSSVYFSLSHSGNAVAVAVSERAVGIDLESLAAMSKNCDAIAKRVLTDSEQAYFASLAQEERQRFVLSRWVSKEALFKLNGKGAFVPSQMDVSQSRIVCRDIEMGERYVLAVALE